MDAGAPAPDNIVFLSNVAVTTVAGGATDGTMDGPLGTGLLSNPVSVAIEPGGSVVVSDYDTSRLRRLSDSGTLSTLTLQSGFLRPFGLAWIQTTLYAHTDANPSGQRDDRTTGTIWSIDRTSGVATAVAANMGRPRAFAALSDGRLVASDDANRRIRVIDVTNGSVFDLAGLAGCAGSSNGTGGDARFMSPQGIVVLPGDRIIVADRDAHILREVSLAGVVTTFAGDGVMGTIDGPRLGSRYVRPSALAVDGNGAIYVTDTGANRVRRIAANDEVKTLAGDGVEGFMDGTGPMAEFFGLEGIAASSAGTTIYVADGTGGSDTPVPYHRIRKITIAP
jgi:DNA-binding beta-propeller fold protein YncE